MPVTLMVLAKGLLIGLAMTAPVGPVGMLCIQRTLQDGIRRGRITGLGAAMADMLYAVIATFGLKAISDTLEYFEFEIRLVGAILLVIMGVRIWLQSYHPPSLDSVTDSGKKSRISAFTSGFIITLTNPVTLIAFMGLMTAFEVGDVGFDPVLAVIFVVAVFAGANMWWLSLSRFTMMMSSRVTENLMNYIKKISSVVILVSALAIFGSIIR